MKNIMRVLLAVSIIVFMFLSQKISYAYKNINYFNEFVDVTKCKVEEYGVRVCFETKINGQELLKCLKKQIILKNNMKIYGFNDEKNNKIEFGNYNIKGYVVIQNINNIRYVTLEVLEKSSENRLDELEEYVKCINKDMPKDKIRCYKYLKGKLPNYNLKKMNDKLIFLLKNTGSINIDSININNGFSTCAYTNTYNAEKNNGKLMDFNYALNNYLSGKYIVIGTPEIITTY